jgi:uncharacterized protein YaeQ
MAQRSTVHRVGIQLSDTDRQVYEDLQLSVARADSETLHRLVARLLAYCLHYERDIAFTQGVGAGDEPDLWVKTQDGRVKVWIEVGLPHAKRQLKAARHCERVVLLAYGPALPRWRREQLPELAAARNVEVTALDFPFLDRLAAGVERTLAWNLVVSGGTLYLDTGKEQFESALEPLTPGSRRTG